MIKTKNEPTKVSHAAKKKQNNDKSGIKALRKEHLRQEAVARQIRRLTRFESDLQKNPNDELLPATIEHAKLTLKKIVGKKALSVARH